MESRAYGGAYRGAWDAITALPFVQQLAMHEEWSEYLGLGPGGETTAARKRKRFKLAVKCLREAAAYHGVAPTVVVEIHEYTEARQALGLELSWQQVWRAFGGWRYAREALAEEEPQPSPAQVSQGRAARGTRRVPSPYIEQVRHWLKRHKPPSTTKPDHEAYVVDHNENRGPGEAKLVLPGTICTQLGISWENVLAVALEEKSVEEAQQERLNELGLCPELPLVGTRDIARMTGRVYTKVAAETQDPKFPVSVATVHDQRAWLLGDVRAFYAKESVPRREPGEMQHLILDSREMQERLDRSGDDIRTAINKKAWNRVPRPAGQLSAKHFWLRGVVDEWAPQYKVRRSRRKAAARRPPADT